MAVYDRVWTQAGDWRVHARVSAQPPPRRKETVVLVHGLGLSGRYMLPTADRLAPHYRVWLPDLPGFGDSDKPPRALDIPALGEALAAWARARGLPPATYLGNSMGCQFIADMAARHPGLVARAVLQGPTTPPREHSWVIQFIRWRQNAPFNPPGMEAIADEDYDKSGRWRVWRTFRHGLDDRMEDKLPLIQAPSLVVRGAKDPICSESWAEEVARRLPDGRLVLIPGVAHTLCFTAPDQLAAVTRQFMEEGGNRD